MATIKIDRKRLELAASKLRAIAHPMRIAIINMLEEKSKMNVTEIHTKLNIEQAAASHHLNILKTKGILASKRDGKMSYYYLRHSTLTQIIDCLERCDL